jgi:hypothetical protein
LLHAFIEVLVTTFQVSPVDTSDTAHSWAAT